MAGASRKRRTSAGASPAKADPGGRQRAAAARRSEEASPAARLKITIDHVACSVREHTSRASQELGRQRDVLQGSLRQNPGWRTLDPASRDRAGEHIDRFIEQQQRHLQDRWDKTSDFAEQLDEIAANLADNQQAERENEEVPVTELDRRHQAQLSELADLAMKIEAAVATLMRSDDDRLKDERSAVATVLATGSGDAIEAALRKVEQGRELSRRLDREVTALEQEIDRLAQEILDSPAPRRLPRRREP